MDQDCFAHAVFESTNAEAVMGGREFSLHFDSWFVMRSLDTIVRRSIMIQRVDSNTLAAFECSRVTTSLLIITKSTDILVAITVILLDVITSAFAGINAHFKKVIEIGGNIGEGKHDRW